MTRLLIVCAVGAWFASCIAYESPSQFPVHKSSRMEQQRGYCSAKVEAGICVKFSDGNVGGFTFSEFKTAVTGVYRTGTFSVPITGSVNGNTYQLSACYRAFQFDLSLDKETQRGKGHMEVGDVTADFELYPFGSPPTNPTYSDSETGSVVGLWDAFSQNVTSSTVALMKNDAILYMSAPRSSTCDIFIGTLYKTHKFILSKLVDHTDDYTDLHGMFNEAVTAATATLTHSTFAESSTTQVVLKKQVRNE